MSRRLQVLLDESEIADIRRIAHCHHLTVAEWVRHALQEACQRENGRTTEEKLEAVRRGIRHDFPAGEIDEILHQICEVADRAEDDTAYLLRSPANRDRLLRAIENVSR